MDLNTEEGSQQLMTSQLKTSEYFNTSINPSPDNEKERKNTMKLVGHRRIPVPKFIFVQMRIFEKYKCCDCLYTCCCVKTSRYLLSTIDGTELESYYTLKKIAVQAYNESNPQHEDSLRFLYISCLKSDLTPSLVNSEWKRVGFQTDNPRNDFRGAGYLSLLFIIFFVKQYEEEFDEIIKDCEHFLFGVNAIKISFYFILALDLFENEQQCNQLRKLHKVKKVTIPQFKNFIKRQSRNENYVYEILSKLLIYLKAEYRKMEERVGVGINIISVDSQIVKWFSFIYSELDTED